MRKTKIVCTLGPASNDADTIRAMIDAGMNVARLNMSHGDHDSHSKSIAMLKEIRANANKPLAILLDTKGPEFRIKKFKEGKATLVEGENFILTTGDVEGDNSIVSITYKDLPNVLKKGDRILLNDGLIELEVESLTKFDIVTKVIVGGELSNNKSINLPNVNVEMPYLSTTDKADIKFAVENDVDYIALSYVRSADDVATTRKYINSVGGKDSNILLISKIENAEGIKNIDSIIEASDGVMVARGDLGVEVDLAMIPVYQKMIVDKCLKAGKLVIIATQMLESMVESPRPTRAEVTDVANACLDGASAVMLSGETAAGKNVIKAISTMSDIINKSEKGFVVRTKSAEINEFSDRTSSIAFACKSLADAIKPDAIVVVTVSGKSAYKVSSYRPNSEIVACCCDDKVYNQLALCWGTEAIRIEKVNTTDELLKTALESALEEGLVKKGDTIIQTAGLPLGEHETNFLKIETI